ncbi:MAG TPA: hypothetical protein VII52_13910 [Gemmatimonadaceae bacterium]
MLRHTLFAVIFATILPYASPIANRMAKPPVNITGHWEAVVTGDGKTFSFLFNLVSKGESLTGTVELSTQDRTFPISDGKISDDKVSFKGFGNWTGQLVGQELRLTRGLDYGRTQEMVAHRTAP